VGRMLDLFDLDVALARWGETPQSTNVLQHGSEAMR
jgi:hypothetical protein